MAHNSLRLTVAIPLREMYATHLPAARLPVWQGLPA